jgi:hypothetical protein
MLTNMRAKFIVKTMQYLSANKVLATSAAPATNTIVPAYRAGVHLNRNRNNESTPMNVAYQKQLSLVHLLSPRELQINAPPLTLPQDLPPDGHVKPKEAKSKCIDRCEWFKIKRSVGKRISANFTANTRSYWAWWFTNAPKML